MSYILCHAIMSDGKMGNNLCHYYVVCTNIPTWYTILDYLELCAVNVTRGSVNAYVNNTWMFCRESDLSLPNVRNCVCEWMGAEAE